MEPLRILMLEDYPEDADLAERAIRKEGISIVMHRVDTKEEFVTGIRDFAPDVILSDHSLPQFNSSEALKICRRLRLQVPFILVTGTVSEEFAVNCLKHGADDYVLKGNLSRLPSAITAALKQREEENKRKTAESELRNQNEQLIKINRELDQFVYSVSHNLRAPLMSVLGLINLSKQDFLNKDTLHFPDYFKMMSESIRKLDDTLKEIIDYSKNARIEVLNTKIVLKDLLHECFKKLSYLQEAEGVNIKITDGSEVISSDHYRLSIVFINIIANAIKYRDFNKPESHIHIDITGDDQKANISFKDNGIGIHPEYMSRIFEMFYRASERSHGAGLGLYIAKETIENLGGKISAESTVGVGTIVKIELPVNAQ